MNPNRAKTQTRRRPLFRIEAEVLESRQLMTGGAGDTIALTTGTIAAVNGTSSSPFVIESGHFTAPKGHLTLGVDVVAATNSTLQPQITSISQGGLHVAMSAVPQGPQAHAKGTTAANNPHAVLATINLPHKGTSFSASFATKIAATAKTSGDYLLGYYLPGDANGDGKVDASDLAAIKSLVGKTVNDTAYSFDADSNRDGKITMADYTIAKKNLGRLDHDHARLHGEPRPQRAGGPQQPDHQPVDGPVHGHRRAGGGDQATPSRAARPGPRPLRPMPPAITRSTSRSWQGPTRSRPARPMPSVRRSPGTIQPVTYAVPTVAATTTKTS